MNNPGNPQQAFRFSVFIVESPSPMDLYHGRTEGSLLRNACALNQVPCHVKTVINLETFKLALTTGYREIIADTQRFPILHISAHGSTDGIQFSDGDILNWAGLRLLLTPLNNALDGMLLVCMSSCHGYHGACMAMFPGDQQYPFLALIGNKGTPTWPETAVGFATLYHHLFTGKTFNKAIDAMRAAAGNQDFYLTMAETSRRTYMEAVQILNTATALERLREGQSRT